MLNNLSHKIRYNWSPHIRGRVSFLKSVPLTMSELSLSGDTLEAVLNRLESSYDISKSAESPVFILASGWRSGSTLLQRLLMSSEEIFIWGEPYSETRPIQHLARNLSCFDKDHPEGHVLFAGDLQPGQAHKQWIANLYPDMQALYLAHLAYVERLLSPPLRMGFRMWGIKEVRLDATHALYLNWLFPQSKFLFLVRDPFASWMSYKGKLRETDPWYWERPKLPVWNVKQFISIWVYLVKSFLQHKDKLSAKIVHYEDLVNNSETIEMIQDYLSLEIKSDTLSQKVGATRIKCDLPLYERRYIQEQTKHLLDLLAV